MIWRGAIDIAKTGRYKMPAISLQYPQIHFLKRILLFFINIVVSFLPEGLNDKVPSLGHKMDWRRTSDN